MTDTTEIADKQRNSKPGYGKPPTEHQWKPGQSGNPAGPPKRRTQLWTYICRYMAMTDAELNKLVKKDLTQSQKAALKLVRAVKSGKGTKSENFIRYCIDRDMGKATEHIVVGNEEVLSDEECDEIRELLKSNAD